MDSNPRPVNISRITYVIIALAVLQTIWLSIWVIFLPNATANSKVVTGLGVQFSLGFYIYLPGIMNLQAAFKQGIGMLITFALTATYLISCMGVLWKQNWGRVLLIWSLVIQIAINLIVLFITFDISAIACFVAARSILFNQEAHTYFGTIESPPFFSE